MTAAPIYIDAKYRGHGFDLSVSHASGEVAGIAGARGLD